ncbi:hypothetical protein [Streptomyces sp. S.PB5]|uniref:hypothetical protein n=1 Tax=Streptomyces sp. S.PB5 TaxID=3020844 RepID=UPI0025B2607D|nr:hypothetical protein [Streptomyces sp. S.PB5]MDN3029436.1 hypothetical protein [Streptomyces sp. S.PB5]
MPIKPDPSTPAGAAILDLADLMDGLQERTGEWPGADTAGIVQRWLSRFTFAVLEDLTPQPAGRAWVLRQWGLCTDAVTLWSDEASALTALARQVRRSWDDVAGTEGFPLRPPADDQAVVDLYYGPDKSRGTERYTLHPAAISRHVHRPFTLSLSDTQACAQANSSALFHPQENPDDEGLPCIELAGILVFAHLDADRQAVRISVHLDTTDEQLLRADGTVPVQMEIEDTTVFDNTTPPLPPS